MGFFLYSLAEFTGESRRKGFPTRNGFANCGGSEGWLVDLEYDSPTQIGIRTISNNLEAFVAADLYRFTFGRRLTLLAVRLEMTPNLLYVLTWANDKHKIGRAHV